MCADHVHIVYVRTTEAEKWSLHFKLQENLNGVSSSGEYRRMDKYGGVSGDLI